MPRALSPFRTYRHHEADTSIQRCPGLSLGQLFCPTGLNLAREVGARMAVTGCRFALAGIGINRVKTAIVDEDTPMTTSLGAGVRFTFDVSASCGRIF